MQSSTVFILVFIVCFILFPILTVSLIPFSLMFGMGLVFLLCLSYVVYWVIKSTIERGWSITWKELCEAWKNPTGR